MYEALYRKYRPKTFDDVVGQEYITETLKNQVRTGRLSHAYLFIGTRGTGKTTCARILAKAVNCEHPVDGNPCNQCAACRGIEDGSILDVVEMDAASNNGVDDVRLLREEAVFSPTTVRKRVYIIDEVHMLSKPAFNALLKILEEPPAHLMFILATTELNKVLPTILSRCQRHSFRRLDSETIARRLAWVAEQEGITLEADAARLLGRLADGGMRDGLSLLDQCASSERVDTAAVLHGMGLAGAVRTLSLAESVLRRDVSGALSQFGALWQDGKDPSTLMGELAGLFRDALLLRLAPEGGKGLLSGMYGEDALRTIRLSDSGLLWLLNTIQKYQSAMAGASNPRLQGELCLVELCGVNAEPVSGPDPVPAEKRADPGPENRPVFSERPVEAAPAPPTEPAREMEQEPEPETESPEPEKGVPAPVSETPDPRPTTDFSWVEAMEALRGDFTPGVFHMLLDPAQTAGELYGSELVLRLQPGFVTGVVNTPDNINRIRQGLTRVLGRPIQIRLEPLEEDIREKNSKLDMLSQQFGNVTIR
ncbi:MAG: DNA polymerase III subunit gamma/tau [Oscillospiraceae bacterium]|nr:DNA polymerase III subunit gamma/tau [Oscillospiraceae bacterium]